jgi:gluconolactonase
VVDTGGTAPKPIYVWDVVDGKTLRNKRLFRSMETDAAKGQADGIRCDEAGNVWAAAGWAGEGFDGVQVFAPDGDLIGAIRLPEICANLCFGGPKRNRLFMAASSSIYALYVEARGAGFPGPR